MTRHQGHSDPWPVLERDLAGPARWERGVAVVWACCRRLSKCALARASVVRPSFRASCPRALEPDEHLVIQPISARLDLLPSPSGTASILAKGSACVRSGTLANVPSPSRTSLSGPPRPASSRRSSRPSIDPSAFSPAVGMSVAMEAQPSQASIGSSVVSASSMIGGAYSLSAYVRSSCGSSLLPPPSPRRTTLSPPCRSARACHHRRR